MAKSYQIGASSSESRLEKLIHERLRPGSNKEQIDQRIWDLFGENWAVMFTDLSGFSRNVQKFGIIHFLQIIHESERLLGPSIDDHDGILLKTEGDSMLIIFRNVTKALHCAVTMQRKVKEYNLNREKEEEILLCVGIGTGLVLRIGDRDVFGEEVNSAAKLGEDTAKAWEILVTGAVKKAAEATQEFAFEPLAEKISGVGDAFRLKYSFK